MSCHCTSSQTNLQPRIGIAFSTHNHSSCSRTSALQPPSQHNLFQTKAFGASTCSDRLGVELCGGLKNVISLAAGFCEGLGEGANTRAAVIRLGLKEMAAFALSVGASPETVFEESSGVGDLILTCTVGRGRRLAAAFAQQYASEGACDSEEASARRWAALENELFNGMKLPDWHNAKVFGLDFMMG